MMLLCSAQAYAIHKLQLFDELLDSVSWHLNICAVLSNMDPVPIIVLCICV
jgi:hypothetical protein